MKQTKILTHETHANGWIPAVYMGYMSQNVRLFHVSNLSARKFRFFSAHVSGVIVCVAVGSQRSAGYRTGPAVGARTECRLLQLHTDRPPFIPPVRAMNYSNWTPAKSMLIPDRWFTNHYVSSPRCWLRAVSDRSRKWWARQLHRA